MATIALYANKLNQMPGLVKDVKKAVTDYKAELTSLRKKALQVNKSVCDLEDVINSIQASTQTQDEKANALDEFDRKNEQFIADAVRIDNEVADLIRQRKDDFYGKYSYLKPESEKNWIEKNLDKAAAWCKKHWKAIGTIVIVIAAVVLICTGVGGIIGAMAVGALFGTGIGGVLGGIVSVWTGGSFWEGAESGAFSGAISGIISGGFGFCLSGGGEVALTLAQTMLIGGTSAAGGSFLCDIGDKFIGGEDISWGKIILDTLVSGVIGSVFAGLGYKISRAFSTWIKNSSWISEEKELFRFGKTSNPKYGRVTAYSTPNTNGMSLNFASGSGKSIFRVEFDALHYLHYHIPSLFGSGAHVPLAPIIDSAIIQGILSRLRIILRKK